jgi:hypothetical protein
MPKASHKAGVLAVILVALLSSIGRADTTQWIGPPNGLWGDPLNWTSGVPTISSYAVLTHPFIDDLVPIDLGGVSRAADTIDFLSPYVRLINGSLVTNAMLATHGYDTLNPPATIAIPITSASSTLTLTGRPNSVLHIDAPITGGLALTVQSSYVAFSAPNTYTGPTVATSFGPTTFAGQGSALASTSFEVNTGGRLVLDNRLTNSTDRLNDAAPVRFNGGSLQVIGNSDADGSERVGILDFVTYGGIDLPTQTVKPFTLRAAGLIHRDGATGDVSMDAGAGHRIVLDTVPQLVVGGAGAPATARGTIPWLFGPANLPFTYDAQPGDTPGLRPLNPATELAPSIPDAPPGIWHNVQILTNQTRAADADVNFFSIDGSTLTLLNHSTLRVQGNTLLASAATITGDGILQFPGDAKVFGAALLHIDVPVKANSLDFANVSGDWYLSKPNDIPGGLNVGYRGFITHPQALGTGKVHVEDGSRLSFTIGDATIANDFSFGDPYPVPPATPVFDNLNTRIGISAGSTVTFTGKFSADLIQLALTGGTFRLNGNGAFDALSLFSTNTNWIELNGTFAPAHTSPAFLQISGKVAGSGKFVGQFGPGTIAPGPLGQPGRFTVYEVGQTSLDININGPSAAADYDQLVVQGVVFDLDELAVHLAPDFTPTVGETFLILDNQGADPPFATFENLPQGATFIANNTLFQISYTAGDGNDIALTVVPEPAALMLAAFCIPLFRRRRNEMAVGEGARLGLPESPTPALSRTRLLSLRETAVVGACGRGRRTSLDQTYPRHLRRLLQIHHLQRRRRNIRQLTAFAQPPAFEAIVHHDQLHRISRMRRMRPAGRGVDHLLAVPMVGGHDGRATLAMHRRQDPADAFVHDLDGFHGRLQHAGVAHHVAVGEVDDDLVVRSRIDAPHDLVAHAIGAHLGHLIVRRQRRAVGAELGRGDDLPILAGEGLLAVVVEEERHVRKFFRLGRAELLQSFL